MNVELNRTLEFPPRLPSKPTHSKRTSMKQKHVDLVTTTSQLKPRLGATSRQTPCCCHSATPHTESTIVSPTMVSSTSISEFHMDFSRIQTSNQSVANRYTRHYPPNTASIQRHSETNTHPTLQPRPTKSHFLGKYSRSLSLPTLKNFLDPRLIQFHSTRYASLYIG